MTIQGRSDRWDATNPLTSLIKQYFERMAIFLERKGGTRPDRTYSRCDSHSLSSSLCRLEKVNRSEEERSEAALILNCSVRIVMSHASLN